MRIAVLVGLAVEEVSAEDRREWLSQQRDAIENRKEIPPESRAGFLVVPVVIC